MTFLPIRFPPAVKLLVQVSPIFTRPISSNFLATHAAASVLRGAGRTVIPMGVMMGCWCLMRITYITLTIRVIPNITVVFSAYPITWGMSCLCFAFFLFRGRWLRDGAKLAL